MTLSDAAGSSACVRWAGERPDLGCLSRIRAKLPKDRIRDNPEYDAEPRCSPHVGSSALLMMAIFASVLLYSCLCPHRIATENPAAMSGG
jgi:hypothetical protein